MTDFMKRVWVEIDLDCIEKNIDNIKNLAKGTRIIAVIKADGYGHGAVELGRYFESIGIDFFAVSSSREAMELREGGIISPILILGYTDPIEAEILADYNFCQTVSTLEYAKELSQNITEKGKTINIHIKLNTGMNRLGFDCCDNDPSQDILKVLSLKGLNFEGLFTHFAAADLSGDPDGEYTKLQYSRYIDILNRLQANGFTPKIKHCCNSAATLLNPEYHLDAVRTGIILYGLTPSKDLSLPIKLVPSMSFKAVVSMVHILKEGDALSYGLTFKAESEIPVATVTVGYADGYPRYLSNKGEVLIKGQRCRILGRVCMDQIIVDISSLKNVKEGDEVVLFGTQGSSSITAEEIADIGGTINYEVVCGISRRVPRHYIKNGKKITVHDYLLKGEK